MTTIAELQAALDAHPNCDACEEASCLDKTCRDCSLPLAQPIRDDKGIIGYVHDDCRAHYTCLSLRDAILNSLMLRACAEINALTASERANNMSVALCEMFKVELR
jgi:hypothetical protein